MQTTREHILRYLREHGRGTVEDLAAHVELAPVTVRHHLNVLRESGLVESNAEPAGRGRPRHVFSLSPAGAQALCGERPYETLAANLIEVLGESSELAPQQVFSALAARIAKRRSAEYDGLPLAERMAVLTDLLATEGFVVEFERDGDEFVVRELGCPYRGLTETHRDVCQLDLELVRIVSGGDVVRDAWRGDGHETCTFRVREAIDP